MIRISVRLGLMAAAVTGAFLVVTAAACSGSHKSVSNSAKSASTAPSTSARAAATSAAQFSTQPQAAATSAAAATAVARQASVAAAAASPAAAAAAAPASGGSQASAGGNPSALPDSASLDRKIIRTADVALETKDTEQVIDAVTSVADRFGGYVSGQKTTQTDNVLRGVVTIRVPAEQFDNALFAIKGLAGEGSGTKVTRENITGQDVTEEYADLDARIKNLESLADQLRQLQGIVLQKSNNANDIMTVYRQLNDVTGQIEQAKGRQQALGTLSSLATLSVEVDPPPVAPPLPPVVKHAWTPARTLADALDALAGLGQGLLQTGIWIGVLILPLAAVVAVIVFAVWRLAAARWQSARRGTAP